MIFKKRVKINKNLNANLSNKGVGFSYGIRGLRIGINRKGIYYSVGVPGTGVYKIKYIKRFR